MMILILNDKSYEVADNITLAAFLESLEIKPHGIAIAIQNQVIPKNKWAETILTDKQELMLIHAVSGG